MITTEVKKIIKECFELAPLHNPPNIVFTAGIGENSALIREMVCSGLENLGIVLDPDKNARANRKVYHVESDQSRVGILVVPTNEERAIALQTLELLRK